MIQIKNIKKSYNGVPVLTIPSLEMPSGQTIGLVGNNGAGKTTLFNLILDLIPPTEGYILNHGFQANIQEDWKLFTAAFLDESFLISYLTPEEYFNFVGGLRGLSKKDIEDFILLFSDFFGGEILKQKKYIRDLSKGNQKKVGIASVFLGSPKVILLDEPFANLDPSTQIKLKRLILEFQKRTQASILISSHDLAHVTEVCERIILLEKGIIIKDTMRDSGTLSELEQYFAT